MNSFLLDLRNLLNEYSAIKPKLLRDMLMNRGYSESEIEEGLQLAKSRKIIMLDKYLEVILDDN